MKILAYMTHVGHTALWDNMFSLVTALSMEHEVRICDINDVNQMRGILLQFLKNPDCFDLSIGFNDMGLQWDVGLKDGCLNVYEELNFPHISIMLDEPFNTLVSGYDAPCKNHIVTYLNRPDLEVLDFMYPDKKMKKLFMPLGGTEKLKGEQAINATKEYDVVVSASVWPLDDFGPIWHNDGTPKSIAAILDDVADIMRTYPVSLLPAVREVLNARGMYDKRQV